MYLVDAIKDKCRNAWYTGHEALGNTARKVARASSSTIQAVVGLESQDPIHNAALDAATTLKNDLIHEDNQIWLQDPHGASVTIDDAKRLFVDLATNLHRDGVVNKEAVLINDRGLLAKLIELSNNQEVPSNIRNATQELISTAIEAAAKQRAWFSSACPTYIVDIVSNSGSDDYDAQARSATAAALLLVEIANKSQKKLNVSETVANLLDTIGDKFHGEVGLVVRARLETSIKELISNPNRLLNPDLDLSPNIRQQYTQALGQLFLAGMPTPMRANNDLVTAVHGVIVAHEESSERGCSIKTARENLLELLHKEMEPLNETTVQLNRLKDKFAELTQKVKSHSPIDLDSNLCTAAEQATNPGLQTLVVDASQTHLTKITEEITRLTKKLTEDEYAFHKQLAAVKLAFDNIRINNSAAGIKNLFFERLFDVPHAATTEDSNDDSLDGLKNRFMQFLTSQGHDGNYDFEELFKQDFVDASATGLYKENLSSLAQFKRDLQGQISAKEEILNRFEAEQTKLETSFWQPLYSIINSETIFDTTRTAGVFTHLSSFCQETSRVDIAEKAVRAYQGAAERLINRFIEKKEGDDGEYFIPQDALRELNLTDTERVELNTALTRIVNNFNSQIPKASNFTSVASSAKAALELITNHVRDPLPADGEDLKNRKDLAAQIKEYISRQASAYRQLANVFEYERSQSSSSTITTKLNTLESHIGITGLAALVTPDLAAKTHRALNLRTDIDHIKRELIFFNTLNTPSKKGFSESWEIQATKLSRQSTYEKRLGHALEAMGLDTRNAKLLQEVIKESPYFQDADDNQPFAIIINRLLMSLMQFIHNLMERPQSIALTERSAPNRSYQSQALSL